MFGVCNAMNALREYLNSVAGSSLYCNFGSNSNLHPTELLVDVAVGESVTKATFPRGRDILDE